jgi:hypothetical protein
MPIFMNSLKMQLIITQIQNMSNCIIITLYYKTRIAVKDRIHNRVLYRDKMLTFICSSIWHRSMSAIIIILEYQQVTMSSAVNKLLAYVYPQHH